MHVSQAGPATVMFFVPCLFLLAAHKWPPMSKDSFTEWFRYLTPVALAIIGYFVSGTNTAIKEQTISINALTTKVAVLESKESNLSKLENHLKHRLLTIEDHTKSIDSRVRVLEQNVLNNDMFKAP